MIASALGATARSQKAMTLLPLISPRGHAVRTIARLLPACSLLAATAVPAQTANPAGATAVPVVVIARAIAPAGPGELVLPSTIEAWQETLVYARVDGYVRRWLVDIGDKVTAGQTMVEIDAPEIDQSLAQARAAVGQATANLEIAHISYERWKNLVSRHTVAEQDVDERRATYEARVADLKAAQANVQRLQEMQGFKQVTAPFAGTVTVRNVEHGALIDAGRGTDTHEMYRVAQTDKLRIRVRVPQSNMRAIVPGLDTRVLVAEYPDRVFTGKIVRTAGAVDPTTRTLLTEIELPNPDGVLLPGLYAQVKFSLPTPSTTVLVPTNAVKLGGNGSYVVVVDTPNIVHLTAVTLGRNLGTQLEIVSGLDVGAAVVLNPSDELKDGIGVQAKEAAAPK